MSVPIARMTLRLTFGAMALPIIAQLREQGFGLSGQDSLHFQKDHDAIARLSIRGLITKSELRKAQARLIKAITKAVKV